MSRSDYEYPQSSSPPFSSIGSPILNDDVLSLSSSELCTFQIVPSIELMLTPQDYENTKLNEFNEIDCNNIDLDDPGFDSEKFDKLLNEVDAEDKKICVFELCSIKPEEFYDTIKYQDKDGNL